MKVPYPDVEKKMKETFKYEKENENIQKELKIQLEELEKQKDLKTDKVIEYIKSENKSLLWVLRKAIMRFKNLKNFKSSQIHTQDQIDDINKQFLAPIDEDIMDDFTDIINCKTMEETMNEYNERFKKERKEQEAYEKYTIYRYKQ